MDNNLKITVDRAEREVILRREEEGAIVAAFSLRHFETKILIEALLQNPEYEELAIDILVDHEKVRRNHKIP